MAISEHTHVSKTLITAEMKALLSSLWIFFLLNMIFRDIHDLFRPGLLEEMMTGIVNGNPVTDGVLLVGGMVLEIPLAMVPLSQVLTYRVNRWANLIAGGITLAGVLGTKPLDLDDVFFQAVGVLALGLIIWLAWQWPRRKHNE